MGRTIVAGMLAALLASCGPPRLYIRNDTGVDLADYYASLSVTEAEISVDGATWGWKELSRIPKDGVSAAKPVREGRVHSFRYGYTRKGVSSALTEEERVFEDPEDRPVEFRRGRSYELLLEAERVVER